MREIKFRIWNKKTKSYIDNSNNLYSADYRDDWFFVEQFIGLTDKNGKDIYEGDVVRFFASESNDSYRGEILWHDHSWGIKWIDESDNNCPEVDYLFEYINENYNLEVIGNIHK